GEFYSCIDLQRRVVRAEGWLIIADHELFTPAVWAGAARTKQAWNWQSASIRAISSETNHVRTMVGRPWNWPCCHRAPAVRAISAMSSVSDPSTTTTGASAFASPTMW